jgi:hypothetical protein
MKKNYHLNFPSTKKNFSILSYSGWSSDQFVICQKTDDQFFLFRNVRVSIMTLKSGENTMIQGLNTNIAISLSSILLPSFSFFVSVFFLTHQWQKLKNTHYYSKEMIERAVVIQLQLVVQLQIFERNDCY